MARLAAIVHHHGERATAEARAGRRWRQQYQRTQQGMEDQWRSVCWPRVACIGAALSALAASPAARARAYPACPMRRARHMMHLASWLVRSRCSFALVLRRMCEAPARARAALTATPVPVNTRARRALHDVVAAQLDALGAEWASSAGGHRSGHLAGQQQNGLAI